jgi:hypothetical protein
MITLILNNSLLDGFGDNGNIDMSRKRINRKGLICRATPTYVVQLREVEKPKKLYARVFGKFIEITKEELPKYKGFQVGYR